MEDYLEDQVEDMKDTTRKNKTIGEVMERMYRE
jgi:cytochrome c553